MVQIIGKISPIICVQLYGRPSICKILKHLERPRRTVYPELQLHKDRTASTNAWFSSLVIVEKCFKSNEKRINSND